MRVSGPGWLPAARESGLGLKTAASGSPLLGSEKRPLPPLCRGQRRGAYCRAPASSASTPGCPGRPPLWEELVGCLCRAPWLARDLMGAGAGAQVSGDGSRPPGSRPPSAHALCFRRPLLDGCGNLLPGSLPLLFRVVRSRLPLLPSGLRSHVLTWAQPFVAHLPRPAPPPPRGQVLTSTVRLDLSPGWSGPALPGQGRGIGRPRAAAFRSTSADRGPPSPLPGGRCSSQSTAPSPVWSDAMGPWARWVWRPSALGDSKGRGGGWGGGRLWGSLLERGSRPQFGRNNTKPNTALHS